MHPTLGSLAKISNIFLRLSIFPVGRRPAARPSAGNASRWATPSNEVNLLQIKGRMFDNAPDEQSLLERLIEVSTFGLDDLELNRHGKMSGLQRSRLGLMTFIYFGICGILFSLVIGAIWMILTQPQIFPIPAMLIWVAFCGFGGVQWLRQTLPMWEDVRSGTVLCISGPLQQIHTRVRTGRTSGIYVIHYRIAKKFFDVAFFAPKFIPKNQNCHVYYTPKSEIIIGIEPI